MKASEIDKGLLVKDPSSPDDDERSYYIPPSQIPVYKEHERVGDDYERSSHDRVWDWWLSLVTADPVAKQEIKIIIPQIYRYRDPATGKEWLFYNKEMYGYDWKGNRKDWSDLEGVVDMPLWKYDREPETNKIKPGTTEEFDHYKEYTIPFSKTKIEEISKYFKTPLSCIIMEPNRRKHSCSLSEFKDMSYDELIDLKNGYTEFMMSRLRGHLKEGGVK
jgi:hypothetical protein